MGAVSKLAPGRDPAGVVETFVAVILGLLMALPLAEPVNNAWSALVVGLGGVVVAFWVAKEKLLAALTGVIRAAFALALTLGLSLDPSVETGIVMAVSAAVTFWLRSQVTAPIDEDGNRVRVVDGVVLSSRTVPLRD